MDFSRIPFSSALCRLGHLLAVDTFARLACINTSLKELCPLRQFYYIGTNKITDGAVKLAFDEVRDEEEDGSFSYMSPEAMFNCGPVECSILSLDRTDEIPAVAITCSSQLWLGVLDPSILDFVSNRPSIIIVRDNITSSASLTLAQLLAHLGPAVEHLRVPWTSFADADDIRNRELTRRAGVPLKLLEIAMPTLECSLVWLRRNADFLARGNLSRRTLVSSPQEEDRSADWLELLHFAARPFCEHETEGGRHLSVFVGNQTWEFHFSPKCTECDSHSRPS